MKILITAVNSFLGSHLAICMAQSNYKVRGLIRNVNNKSIELAPYVKLTQFALGEKIDHKILCGQDVIIHCAHDFSKDLETSFRVNIEGTKLLFQMAEAAGIKQQIFISSYSAHPLASSNYGKVKYELEQFFLEKKQTIVRPGLVIGDGGLFFRNMKKILATPIMPLLDGGKEPLAVIAVDDFVRAMLKIVNENKYGEFNLFNQELISLKEFIQLINQIADHKSLYINIPSNIASKLLRLTSKIGFKLPVSVENIKGLKNNTKCNYESHLNTLLKDTIPLKLMLKKVIAVNHK